MSVAHSGDHSLRALGNTATNTISGTSMATPHVAGVAALYLQTNTSATPSQVAAALRDNATPNTITLHSRSSSNGTPNLFLYMGFIGGGSEPPPPGNAAPVASFTVSCAALTCSFTDGSSDSDGSLASRSWSFGDGGTSSAQNPSHTYAAGGTYTAALTVTDDDGATASTQRTVTVTAPSSGISLTATGTKVRGLQTVNLQWSGATSTSVDIFRDGLRIVTTANDGEHTDNLNTRGGGSYTYRVCAAGTSTCSSNVMVTF